MAVRLVSWRSAVIVAAGLVLMSVARAGQAENWTRFRGGNGTGISALRGLPTTWSPGEYDWNIELPGEGHSSPVIWGNRLFVTSAIDRGAVRSLFCIDTDTGRTLWSRETGFDRSRKHAKSSWASGTPATDGRHVYVAFADGQSYTLTAYDFDGNLTWRRNLGRFESQHGHGVSPILFEDMVIIPNDQDGPSSVIALDKQTGQTRWSRLRPAKRADVNGDRVQETAYSTPILVTDGDRPQLIVVSGATGVTSLDPYTGDKHWSTPALPMRTVASPAYADGLVFVTCGSGGTGGALLQAVKTALDEPADGSRIAWTRKRMLPYVPTPIAYQGHLYLIGDNGVASCVRISDGKNIWTERIGGNYSGSPVCVDGKIYTISEKGDVVCLAASPEYKLYGTTALGDSSHATPAVADGRIYFRTVHRLMALPAAGSRTSE